MLFPLCVTFNLMVTSEPFAADSGAMIVTADLSARTMPVESNKIAVKQNRILPNFFMINSPFFIKTCFQDIFLAREKKRESGIIFIIAFINNYLFLFKEGMLWWQQQPAQSYHIKID